MSTEPVAALGLADVTPSYLLTPDDLTAIHTRVMDVAHAVLDEDGRAAISLFIRGMSQQQAAKSLGWSETKMSRVLHGSSANSNSGKVSALKVLTDALRADPMFVSIYRAIRSTFEGRAKERVVEPPPDAVITDWYLETVRPQLPGLFTPLAVLMVADRLADRKRELKLADLSPYIPAGVLTLSIGPLQVRGYIKTDGITIRILKTPVDGIKASQRPSPRSVASEFVNGIIHEMERTQ